MDTIEGNNGGKRLSQGNNVNSSSRDLENGGVTKRHSIKYPNGSKPDEVHFEQLDFQPSGCLQTTLAKVGGSTEDFLKKNRSSLNIIFMFILNGLVIGFFFGCLFYWINNGSEPLQLCNGFGSLIAILTIVYGFLFYFLILKKYFGSWFRRKIWRHVQKLCSRLWKIIIFRWLVSLSIVSAFALFLYFDTDGNANRLISLLGLFIILLLGFIFSANPGRVNWRTVSVGLGLQFLFGLVFIRWPTGRAALQCFSDKVATFLSYGVDGAAFVYGDLLVRTEGVFAFSTLSVIFFFSMLMEVLFFWGALQWFCRKLGSLLQWATGTTVCESVISVGNIFLGMTESVLLVKPYMSLLTPSEIHVIMASGFATVSGTILAAYIGFGAEPAHLVTASVMSAPAAICYSKLLMPETKRSLTSVDNLQPYKSEDRSALSAATRGASNGTFLILNIIANLIAFVSCIAFVNGVLGYCGGLLGNPELNLEWVLGKVFIPLCWVMGVPWEECELVGSLIGLKTVVNEFVAYEKMGAYKKQGLLSERAELIATYSLCGFTNPSSAGIMIGALSAIAPNQREVLSSVAVRAFFAGCGICFMTACIAENEAEDENLTIKWVPKKKHEVLKAKYKCLKKLFQIYDASLIGMLPTGYEEGDSQYVEVQAEGKHRRKKHSHRTRTNAQTGTSEEYSTETGTEELPSSQSLITTTQVINQSEDNLSVVESERSQITAITQSTQSTNENVSQIQLVHSRSCQDYGVGGYDSFDPRIRGHRLSQSMPMDIFYRHDRMRRTRFQAFINRIFGIRSYPSMYVIPDKNLTDRYGEKRTRRGIRFGRSRRPKKAIMPYNATDLNSPVILDYIQSVQRSCLTDRTPRQCPIVGCRMIYYGIINYNDHLNLCHFPERKFICHYCHEGFESETDKILHENEHLGLNKLNIAINIPQPVMSNVKIARQTNCDIQTENNDLAAEKLKKIVSLFDKIVESDQINDEIKKKRFSDSNIQQKSFDTTSSTVQSMGKQTLSLTRTVHPSSVAVVNPKCHVCGESFDNRTQLNLHVNYEHRAHAKFSKFHSCAGIVNVPKKTIDLVSKDGQINVESVARNSFGVIQSTTTIPSKKTKSESQGSAQDLNSSCFSASTLTKKPSTISSILNTMKTSMYKWEPGTKIINV